MESLSFPQSGQSADSVLKELGILKEKDLGNHPGRSFSLSYEASSDHSRFIEKSHQVFFSHNALNPIATPSLRQIEHEVVRMCADLFHGDRHSVGVVTSGGTESILMAVKTYREKAKKGKPWITHPEMVVPENAHPAFVLAAQTLGIKILFCPIGVDFRVDLKELKRIVGRNTIMIAASAPQYPQGVVDPVAQMGEIALAHGVPLHVDATFGFNLPFMEKLKCAVPVFDFRIPGVTSISSDLSKYGYTGQGASVLLYRSMNIMKHQFFVHTEWKGGRIYATPTLQGSRAGAPIAAAWASIKKLGIKGYLDFTSKSIEAKDLFLKELTRVPELHVIVHPDSMLFAIGSKDKNISIFAVADQLQEKGWYVDRQQHPSSFHMAFTPSHLETIKDFMIDLRLSVEAVKEDPSLNKKGLSAWYVKLENIPFQGVLKNSVLGIMEKMYGNELKFPGNAYHVEDWNGFVEKFSDNIFEVKKQLDDLWLRVKKR